MSAPTTAHAEKSKKQIAYEMLKEKIITNQLAPGTMLVERQLCEMLNSSRTPIREAIQQLSADGLVTSIPTVGSYVSEIRYEYVIQLYDVREYLEGLAAKLCAINITDSQIQALNRCWLNMNDDIRTKDYDKLFQEDSNFHQNIVDYSRNEILQTLYQPDFPHHFPDRGPGRRNRPIPRLPFKDSPGHHPSPGRGGGESDA